MAAPCGARGTKHLRGSTYASRQLQLSRLAQLVERKTLNLVVVGSSPTVGGLFVYFGEGRATDTASDPVLRTALAARLHAREVQGGRLKICWAKVRLGSNPSAGKTFCPASRFLF